MSPAHLRTLLTASLLGLLLALSLQAAADTLQRIRDNNGIVLGFVPAYAPFSDGDAQQARGYTIDLCLQVAEQLKHQLALPGLQVHFQPVSIADMLNAVSEGRVDILCSPVDETLKRRQQVSFSLPVFISGLGVILRSDAPPALRNRLENPPQEKAPLWRGNVHTELASYRFAVLAGSNSADWVRRRMLGLGLKSSPREVENTEAGIALVSSGQVDAFFDDRAVLLNYAARQAESNQLLVARRLFDMTPAALVLARNDDDFRLLVDSTLSELFHAGGGESLYRSHFGEPSSATLQLFRLQPRP
jgi:polar amino acid transport system substrate-binding protein